MVAVAAVQYQCQTDQACNYNMDCYSRICGRGKCELVYCENCASNSEGECRHDEVSGRRCRYSERASLTREDSAELLVR